ncbi:MAG: ABC transporter permease [Oscillospiraceae bacterium]|nr:ABC transporter permease [Oscillospiraceae bacterium]
MKRNMMRRTTLREIRATLGRFLAIMAIIMLGVGFFAGIRVTMPDMIATVDRFFEEGNLYDFRLVSTLGWEEQDVDALREQEGVRFAEGCHSLDVICEGEDETGFVLKTHSIPKDINLLQLTEGRMPESPDECLMDAGMAETTGMIVGSTVRVSDSNDEDTIDALKYQEFKVVGACHSTYYLNFERGTTSIGDGTVRAYLYLPPESFDVDYYTEIFVSLDNDDAIYSKPYKDTIKALTPVWENLTETQATARYDRIVADAEAEIADGREELEEKRAEGQQELDDAKKELRDGKQELDDAEQELADAKQELEDAVQELTEAKEELDKAEQELADGKKKLDDSKEELDKAEKELADGKQQLDDNGKKLEDAKRQLDESEQQIKDGESQLAAGQQQLDAAWAEINAGAAQIDDAESQLATQEQAVQMQIEQLQPMWDMLPEETKAQLTAAQEQINAARAQIQAQRAALDAGRQQVQENQDTLNAKKQELAAGRAAFEAGRSEYENGKRQYDEAVAKYEEGKAKFEDGKKQYEDGLKDYEDGVKQFEEGKQKYEDGLKEYEDGKQKYEDGLVEFEDGKKEYEDGLKEYKDGKKEFDEKIADAEQELADAEQEVADLEKPDTFVLDRNTNIGYSCFESDSQIVDQVAQVFPVFFILVAILVCMTTMSRMVEEQRTQIGVLKALGYSEFTIMGKYMAYSGIAAVIGCILGYAMGSLVFPTVIWMSYELMYIPLPLIYVLNWKLALAMLGVSLLCSMGTTWLSCRIELSETAASLMRPKAPKAGKRVLLEYLPFIWNRLKFLHKVSIRNIFRYKRRFFMMVFGISGCMALLLTGFGLRDSVAGFADIQYGEIILADAQAGFKESYSEVLPADLQKIIDDNTESCLLMHAGSWDLVTEEKVKSLTLMAPYETERIADYMELHTMTDEPIPFPEVGEAVISNSIHDRYGINTGDTVTLRNEDLQEIHVRISGIFENHVYNYIMMRPETIKEQTGDMPEINSAFLNFPEDADVYQLSAEISKDDRVTTILLFDELRERMNKMMGSLNYIVLLIIACAAGLAFVVLYNLTNINITERIREIATIKVLGFFKNETSAYVLRENLALTIIGIGVGIVLGIMLNHYVIDHIIVDLVSFRNQVMPLSYVYSIALTLSFNVIVNLFMGIKLERINMAESLKSVD